MKIQCATCVAPARLCRVGLLAFTLAIAVPPVFADGYTVPCDNSATCPWCNMNLNQPIGVAPLMDMPIRWLAMGDAPAVVDASVSCKNPRDYNAMLRERQDRAGICVWLYQGEILFSSANIRHAAISAPIAADPNTGVGAPGDVVVMRNPPHVTCSSIGSSSEIEDLWSEGDRVWNSYPVSLGILALSARMLPDAFGTDCRIDGVANVGSFTRPYLAVADPTLFCYRDELNLAHEIGHVMSLGHRFDNPTFLMHWQSTGNNLSADEVRQARLWAALYLYGWPFWGAENLLASDATPANALPETRLRRNRVAAVLDSTGDVSDELGSLDWSKVVVVGREGADGGLGSFGALRDTISDTPTTYYFGIDTDANARTGASTKTLDPRWRMRGAELVVRLRVERGRERDSVRVYPTLYKAVRSGFVELKLGGGDLFTYASNVKTAFCSHERDVSVTVPTFAEVGFLLTRRSMQAAGIRMGSLSRGVRIQTFAMSADTIRRGADLAPNLPRLVRLPFLSYPTLAAPDSLAIGDRATARVSGLSAGVIVEVILANVRIPTKAKTDKAGNATVAFVVPEGLPVGRLKLTVASTADGVAASTVTRITSAKPRR